MRSRNVWLAACAAAVSVLAACSGDDDPSKPIVNEQANRPGAAGASGTSNPPASPATPAPTGSNEAMTPPPVASGNNGAAAGSNSADAGAGDAGAPAAADAGAAAAADAGGPPPGNQPGNPPPPNAVGFSNVFQLLLDNCGTCHGANAPNNRPRFAQAGNQAASYAVTQANGVAADMIAEAVTARTMPPSCNRGALGTGTCLDANEAAQLQAWLAQGAQP